MSALEAETPPRLTIRVSLAVFFALIAWLLMTVRVRAGGPYLLASDYTLHWWAADAMIRGYSPYVVINAFTKQYPFCSGYLYMLPAAILLLPLGFVSMQTAFPIFSALSVGLFSFALTKDGLWRLPLLASAPMIYGVLGGQVVPLVLAALLIPSLGWLAPMKFTLGAVGALYTLSLRYIILAAAMIVGTMAVFPWWPRQWWAERNDVAGHYYHIPVLLLGGVVLLAALVRWRRPEARLLAAMACIPQTMLYYDQLPLGLIARNYREALRFAVFSYVAPAVSILLYGTGGIDREILFARTAPIILCCYYIPCLIVVLLRRNEGELPAWLERLTGRLPPFLRGSAPASAGSASF